MTEYKHSLDQEPRAEKSVEEGLRAISDLGQALLREKRSERRWKNFRRILFWLVVLAIFVVPHFVEKRLSPIAAVGAKPHAAVINLEGLVMPGAEIDADQMVEALNQAFGAAQSRGVILQINSPGGSPVQAERIFNEIIRLKQSHPDKKVIAVIEDMGVSAAYYIAAAADQIVASKASLVGSIGVIINGFGAVDAIEKLGIERRLITAGDNKALMDPFSPRDPEQEAYMQRIVDQVHTQFIDAVKQGRGERLAQRADIFSGLIWNGEQAQALGLVDHVGSTGYALRELLELENTVDYTPVDDWFRTFSRQVGVGVGSALNGVVAKQGLELK